MHEALSWLGYKTAALVMWLFSLPAVLVWLLTVLVVLAVAGYFDWCDRRDRIDGGAQKR
jgi:hypothetical protein